MKGGAVATGYSHIVIGAGAIGSATAYWLSQQGAERVLVLEQFDLINTLGSSGDHSRIIRHAYHSTDYTRLTPAMFEAWRHVEEHSGLQVYLKTGGLDLAPNTAAGRAEIDSYRAALSAENIPFDELTAEEVRAAYPQWRIDDDAFGIRQEAGGLLDIRRSVSAHTALALAAGVEFRPHTHVTGLTVHERGVTVQTDAGAIDADNLVVAAGSWLEELMPGLGLNFNLTLSQEQVSYFASPSLADFTPEKFPIWVYHGEEVFYGFPVYGEAGVKLARDMRGHFIEAADRVYEGDETEASILRGFLQRHLPAAVGPTLSNRTCVYDMPADRDFVLDVLPQHPHVAVFNGAGHAGKFASLVGKILAELATAGASTHPIEAFSLLRPAITDPNFEPTFRLING